METRISYSLSKGKAWINLNELSNTGIIKAGHITKKNHVLDNDGHHCEIVHVKTSIRYHPKKWVR